MTLFVCQECVLVISTFVFYTAQCNVNSENWNWPILIVCAVIYGILLVLLMVYEGMQLFILHRQYLKEMENYIEWFVFLVAMGTPFIKVSHVDFMGVF